MQDQISWLLLDLHCLQRQGISGSSRTRAADLKGEQITQLREEILSKLFLPCLPSEKESTPKGKKLLPMEANSFL